MTPDEKILKIRELEKEFVAKLETIKKEYQQEIRVILADIEKKKVESLKKDLGM